MKAREVYDAIRRGRKEDNQQALFELLSLTQALSTAVIELAGNVKLKTRNDPLSSRSRLPIAEFLELPKERNSASERFEVEHTPHGLVSHGPFEAHKLTLDGYRIPRLTGRVINGRWYFTLDERYGVDVPERDGAGVAMMIANALAIGAGFSCFGENSQPSNEFKTRMHCITVAASDIDAMQPESESAQ